MKMICRLWNAVFQRQKSGMIYAGGYFVQGKPPKYIARWNGMSWDITRKNSK